MKYLFLIAMFLMTSNLNFAQEASNKSASKEKVELFNMVLRYQLNIYNKYTYQEKTEIQRIRENKETFEFSRTADYFFNSRMKSIPENQFTTLTINIDSLTHTIRNKEKEITLNSQNTDFSNWNEDYDQYFIPVSKEFDLLIDPYYDVAKISGKKIEADREYLNSNEEAMKTVDFAMWTNSLSNERLLQICDPKKISFPIEKIGVDSTWKTPINFQVEGFNVFDTITVKFKEIKGGFFFLEAEFPVRYFQNIGSVIYGERNNLSFIENMDLKAKFLLTVSPSYMIDEANLEVSGKMNLRNKSEKFTDMIKTTYKWNLLGRWK